MSIIAIILLAFTSLLLGRWSLSGEIRDLRRKVHVGKIVTDAIPQAFGKAMSDALERRGAAPLDNNERRIFFTLVTIHILSEVTKAESQVKVEK